MRFDTAVIFENWNRFYDPSVGRYLSPDPILLSPGSIVRAASSGMSMPAYAYAVNNPIIFVDPMGLESGIFVDGLASGGFGSFFGGIGDSLMGATTADFTMGAFVESASRRLNPAFNSWGEALSAVGKVMFAPSGIPASQRDRLAVATLDEIPTIRQNYSIQSKFGPGQEEYGASGNDSHATQPAPVPERVLPSGKIIREYQLNPGDTWQGHSHPNVQPNNVGSRPDAELARKIVVYWRRDDDGAIFKLEGGRLYEYNRDTQSFSWIPNLVIK